MWRKQKGGQMKVNQFVKTTSIILKLTQNNNKKMNSKFLINLNWLY